MPNEGGRQNYSVINHHLSTYLINITTLIINHALIFFYSFKEFLTIYRFFIQHSHKSDISQKITINGNTPPFIQ